MFLNIYRSSVIIFCVLWVSKNLLLPVIVAIVYSSDYMEQTVLCDRAMTSSWYIKQMDNESLDKTEVVAMLDCHDYDKTRKVMLISGLSENFLSYLGLRALELHQRPAEEIAQPHRFQAR